MSNVGVFLTVFGVAALLLCLWFDFYNWMWPHE